MTDPLSAGQHSIVALTAGHPLALARLKELMRDAERWRKVRASTGFDYNLPFVTVGRPGSIRIRYTFEWADEVVDALPAIAEGGR